MTSLGFALVLAAALCHATWNFFVKRINGGAELIWLFSVLSALLYLPLAVTIWIRSPAFDLVQLGFIAGSTVFHLLYFIVLQAGYRNGDLSLVYPTARATGPLLSSGLAVVVLGEALSWQIAAGAVVIVFGVFMLTGGLRRSAGNAAVSLGFGVGAGLLIGCYTAWDAYTVSVLAVPPLLVDYASSVGRSIVLAPLAFRRRADVARHWREHRGGVLTIAVFNSLAYILVLVALTFTPVVFVAPIREISVLVTVLMGSLLLGEGNLRHRLGWSAVILAGVVVLASSG
ncbi:DMT family transporter [Rhodobium gokarnense]|uniref:Drug/metabolite transporter (DMT)-like permease n=1 Tax=Rhodobium gokarnense TaxID=364296 RepID=A0ABT3H5S5_9HYPH|nr:DMT family transporter [Rhodobium gokarnense]MCW2305737.1 drug/metabolite transporter (DMT)-like permease [Rhodobium gokarnense]